jgi:hypothetical protein
MGKRSIAKRILLTAGNLKKKSIRVGLKLENYAKESSEETAGPEFVQRMAACQAEGKECLCQRSREEMFKTHAACVPYKITRFKNEYAEFKEKIKKPGELTVDDVKSWPVVILMGCLLFWLGKSIGRWNLIDFKYKDF